jgi:hypothetical protein
MAGVSPFEIIAGPARVWLAPTATTFPDDDTADTENGVGEQFEFFTDLGRTDAGVEVLFNQTQKVIYTDQVTGPVKVIRVEEIIMVKFNLADSTVENFFFAVGRVGTSVSDDGNSKSTSLFRGTTVQQYALLVRGDSPYEADAFLQLELPVVVQSGNPSIKFVKQDKSVLATEWSVIEDQNASDVSKKFGTLRARYN